ncbi:MauM/NapG family ferredoxin-type protein [Shewanella halifaxensis HAW-EB4]|uniref:MauM/NapG family ferredoxin-type protein n=1 Tax=Shewanella halifaxensis (strain HAW-EB4) TaxID=458817 RepID=B0TSW4_SHEHH|nr:ferredoxin-type protein NapG [Shewanella halifaxensis]ABZ75289.1 MauM/NapG family ferredoxin-type protein [Shewanella halifaxensis HAW-EB4]
MSTVNQSKFAAKGVNRRQFLATSAKATCAMGLLGMGLTAVAKQSSQLDPLAIRPPGALSEDDFLSACVRCGLCVEACPYDTLKLARWFEGAPTGTPYFTARNTPCEMCEDIPCVKACPSGSLNHELTDIDDSKMGIAVLTDEKNCLNFKGLRCDVCYRVCPLIDDAITLEMQHNARSGHHAMFLPKVNSDSCTGCGKCEHVCVLEEPAIKVLPTHIALGKTASHDTYINTEETTLEMLNKGLEL